MTTLGLNFQADLEKAGLGNLPISWGKDGTIVGNIDDATRAKVQKVIDKHVPDPALEPQGEWIEGLYILNRLKEAGISSSEFASNLFERDIGLFFDVCMRGGIREGRLDELIEAGAVPERKRALIKRVT